MPVPGGGDVVLVGWRYSPGVVMYILYRGGGGGGVGWGGVRVQ